MKKLYLPLLILFSTNLFAQFLPEPDPHRGMYIDKFFKTSLISSSIIDTPFTVLGVDVDFDGIFEKEDSILKYASENHITYLALYDLHKIFGRSLTLWDENLNKHVNIEEHLVRFMRKAKSQYGITQLGAVGGSVTFFDSLANFMDRYPKADFDVVNIEHEFWTACTSEYYNYIDIQQAMYDMKETYNLSHPTNQIISEAYLAALYVCNSSFGTQNIVETIDGCKACSPCSTCTNPHSRKSDRILYAWYIADPASMNLVEQNDFEVASTEDSTDFHPILYSESFNTGGTANFTGAWFPLNQINNIFSAEASYYTHWRNNSSVAFGTARQNNVQPGGVHWFTSTNMVGHLDKPQILQNTGPYCSSGSDVKINFNYYGPIENGITYQFWISRDDDGLTVYPQAGGKLNGISKMYQPLTGSTPLKKNIDFTDTLIFKPCYLPVGNYTAHLAIQYDSSNGENYQCSNKVIVDTKPRIEINGPSSFCEGRYTYLKVNNTGGTISWYKDGSLISGSSTSLLVTKDGDYSCLVSGGSGCSGISDTVHVHVLSNPSIAVNAVCNPDGSVTLKTNLNDPDSTSSELSGPGGVLYRWNTGETTDQISFIPPTSNTVYRVNVTNPYTGCARTGQITVKSPLIAPYAASITVITAPASSCSSNGTLTANHFSTGGPTSYLWSNGETTRTITNVPPGNYSVAMNVWSSGCTSYANTTLGSTPTNPPIVLESIQHVTCTGESDGSIQLNISGGNPPFTYFWERFPDDSIHDPAAKDQSDLFEGTYTIRITDAGNCNYYFSYTIDNVYESPQIQGIITSAVSGCSNSLNGTATVTAIGGTGPYSYLWNDALHQTTATATGLAAGTTQIIVTDNNGCEVLGFAHVNSTQSIIQTEILDSSRTSISCLTSADAKLFIQINGGLAPYLISGTWQADSNFAMLENLNTGYHLIEITDANGCSILDSFLIDSPNAIELFSSTNPTSCIGCTNGSFDISFNGGTAPYQISWTPMIGNLSGNKIQNLSGGIYSICVEDRNNCQTCIQDTIFENNIGMTELNIDEVIKVYPNPFSNYTRIELTQQIIADGKLQIISLDGKTVIEYDLSSEPLILLSGELNPGLYFLKFSGSRGELFSGVKKLVVIN